MPSERVPDHEPKVSAARATGSAASPAFGPGRGAPVSLLGVNYVHLRTRDGGDLYLTEYGQAFPGQLQPENWFDPHWFAAKRQRLVGTSTIYRVPTKAVADRSLDLVVRYCRVGEEVPVDTVTLNRFLHADFNSPFEEFAVVKELRAGRFGPPGLRIRTQKPLAIYVPPGRLELWQTGRLENKIQAKLARNPGVELDILRQYLVLFRWIKGLDAVQMSDALGLRGEARERFLGQVTTLAVHELEQKGFRMLDVKPQHIILRRRAGGSLLRDRHGQLAYAVIDYELLERTPEHEAMVFSQTRQVYSLSRRMAAVEASPLAFPTHLAPARVLGVDYLFGHAESTGGRLWVAGNESRLFNYFLPERWRRTPARRLAGRDEAYVTRTKDHLGLVWRVSCLGAIPPATGPEAETLRQAGFNSPFEEFALARKLIEAGVPVLIPRAIYATGRRLNASPPPDQRRLELDKLRPQDGQGLDAEHAYIMLWDCWSGDDLHPCAEDQDVLTGLLDGADARAAGLLEEAGLRELMRRAHAHLAAAGYEDLDLNPEHLLFAREPGGRLRRGGDGLIVFAIGNLEFVRSRTSGTEGIPPLVRAR